MSASVFSSPHASLPFVSVVVISKDRHDELEKAVASLLALDYPQDRYEVIVVEEGDKSQPLDGVRYVFLPRRNRGLGFARNTGVGEANGELIAFTDDDCLVDPAWLSEIVARFDDPQVVGVAGATFAQQRGLIGMCEDLLGFPGGGHRRYHEYGGRDGETELLSGCNSTYRRSVFDGLSFKETGFGRLGADDFLMGLSAARRGTCLYVPSAVVYHKPRGSLRRIVTWFGRRKINEMLFAEEKEGVKNFAFLLREPHRVVLFRVLAMVGIMAGLGRLGVALVGAGFAAWYVFMVLRSIPLLRYFPDRRVSLVVPFVRLAMDIGVMSAEWKYLTQSHERLGLALEEYQR